MHWIVLPLVAGLIGWLTNFLAVRMIFRPHRPIRLLGLTFQGLLPKRRKEFAVKIAETVSEHLISTDDIKAVLENPEMRSQLQGVLEERVDSFFEKKLIAAVPMLGAFMRGTMFDKVKSTLMEELNGMLTAQVGVLGESIDSAMDLRATVEQKIHDFDFETLELIVLQVAKTELRWIEILGAILGFLIGCLQLLWLHWLA